ncbi:MAG: carboxymuconolactone decarboxylase family protein [Bdellovibrionota bacterium]
MKMPEFSQQLPDFAKDIRLNLGSILSVEGAPGLTLGQIWGLSLAVAYTLRSKGLLDSVLESSAELLTDAHREAARAASSIMAMNNIYYRSSHLIEDPELSTLPARLRMNVIAKPGIEKIDFELYSLAISAVNGCGMCLKAHAHELRKAGLSLDGVQSALRIAAVLNAAAHSEWMARS